MLFTQKHQLSQSNCCKNFSPKTWQPLSLAERPKVPLYGAIAPKQSMALLESSDLAPSATRVKRNLYALRVRGNSMIDVAIFEGDIIIIEQCQSLENGESAVVSINNQRVRLKKLCIEKNGIRLQPANQQMATIFLHNQAIEVLGMVIRIARRKSVSVA